MAAVVISRDVIPSPGEARAAIPSAEMRAPKRTQPKMTLHSGNLRVTVPYTPKESSHTGFVSVWNEVPRPGRVPLVLRQGPGLWKMTFTLFLGHQNPNQAIDTEWNGLRALAESAEPITIAGGPGNNKTWHITNMTLNVTARAAGTNRITRATVECEFTQSSELARAPGPVAGGKKAPATKPTAGKPSAKPTVRIHTVTKGQTLPSISNIYYRTPSRWKEIATANHLRDANAIKVGMKLRIP